MDPTALCLAVGGVCVALAGAWYGAQLWAQSLVRPVLSVTPETAQLGGTIKLNLRLCPTTTLNCEYVEANLRCQRRYDTGATDGGWDLRRHSRRVNDVEHDELCNSTNYLAAAAFTLPPRPTVLQGEMLVPYDGCFPTRQDGKLQIRWVLRVTIKLQGLPSPTLERELKVVR